MPRPQFTLKTMLMSRTRATRFQSFWHLSAWVIAIAVFAWLRHINAHGIAYAWLLVCVLAIPLPHVTWE